jgi:DEAD/DEAH box helicase domain-containing protein
MALLMRRLTRLCRHYGSQPQFILSSATIANPRELSMQLIGADVKLIDRTRDGSPSGERTFVLWNPPLLDAEGTRRKSASVEATLLVTQLAKAGLRNICFVRARRTAELVMQQARNRLRLEGRDDLASRIQSYRAGYLAAERRKIEQDLSSGNLLGVTATSALELGVDVGCLDATVHVGYPGSIASLWQQVR